MPGLGVLPGCWAGVRPKPPLLEMWRRRGLRLGSLRRSRLLQLCCAHPRADSVAWNPHKLLTAGLQCSALLLRDTSVGLPCPCPPSPLTLDLCLPFCSPLERVLALPCPPHHPI